MGKTEPISRRRFLAASAATLAATVSTRKVSARSAPVALGQKPGSQWQSARELIRSGRIGNVIRGQVNLERRRFGAGEAIEAHFNALAPLLFAVGAGFPKRVSSLGNLAPDGLIMTAEYASGCTLVLTSSLASAERHPPIIRGHKASLELRGSVIALTEDGPRARSGRDSTVLIEAGEGFRGVAGWDADLAFRTQVTLGAAVLACRTGTSMPFDPLQSVFTESILPKMG